MRTPSCPHDPLPPCAEDLRELVRSPGTRLLPGFSLPHRDRPTVAVKNLVINNIVGALDRHRFPWPSTTRSTTSLSAWTVWKVIPLIVPTPDTLLPAGSHLPRQHEARQLRAVPADHADVDLGGRPSREDSVPPREQVPWYLSHRYSSLAASAFGISPGQQDGPLAHEADDRASFVAARNSILIPRRRRRTPDPHTGGLRAPARRPMRNHDDQDRPSQDAPDEGLPHPPM